MNRLKSASAKSVCVLILAISLLATIQGTATAAVIFEDDFTGTAIDVAKWTPSTRCHYNPEQDCSAYCSVSQDESLQLTVGQENIAHPNVTSVMSFDESANSFECEVWQNDVSGWQDWPVGVTTPLAGFGYYNIGTWHWTASWRDASGVVRQTYPLPMPAMQPWQHFRIRVQIAGDELQWLYDVDTGSGFQGYQVAFSTTDFSLPFYYDDQPLQERGKLHLTTTDLGTTYFDNVRVESGVPVLPTCTECGVSCDPEANGYQFVENVVGEQTMRFQIGVPPITLSDEYWYEPGDIFAFGRTWDLSGFGKIWTTYSGWDGDVWRTVWDSENYGEWSGHHLCNDFSGGFGPSGPMIGQSFTITGVADSIAAASGLPDVTCYDYLWNGVWTIKALAPCPDAIGCVIVTCDVSAGIYVRPIDTDNDSFASCEECNDNDSSVYPGAPELCDGKDNDCDGVIPADEFDSDGDGYKGCEGDCDDADAGVNPDAYELPGNMVDENCDGSLGACDPNATWKNHGRYVRCVAHETDDLIEAGILTQEEGDALISSAAQSTVGK